MSSIQRTRRTLFGDLFSAVLGCVVAQKIAKVALAPTPPATPPVVPVVDVIPIPTSGITTHVYDSAGRYMVTIDCSGKTTTFSYETSALDPPST
jgi:hypothetical protein